MHVILIAYEKSRKKNKQQEEESASYLFRIQCDEAHQFIDVNIINENRL